jgi:hypothetical protein
MSFKEVNILRKSGDIKEAFQMATADLQNEPDNIWCKRAMGWVYYEFVKKAVENKDYDEFITQVENINNLNLPPDDTMLYDSIAWQIGKILYATMPSEIFLNKLFDIIQNYTFTYPSDSYSYMLKAFNKHAKEWNRFLDFMNWCGLSNFKEDDYVEFITDKGIKLPSTVESIYISISKKLLTPPIIKANIKQFIPEIARVSNSYKNMQYPPYYYAKLLLTLGDNEHFLEAFLPFARKKQKDFWVWDLLSENYDLNSDEYFSCLCKSMSCGAHDNFTNNVREKLAMILIAKKKYPEAKFELSTIIKTRNNEGWVLQPKHTNWQKYSWWNDSNSTSNNFNLYKNNLDIAEALLFSDTPEELIVIQRLNEDKTVLHFIASKEKYGLLHYGKFRVTPKVGKVYALRFKENNNQQKSSFYKIYSIVPSNKAASDEIYKQIEGHISIRPGNSFGFIDNIFVSQQIINQYQLNDSDLITAIAIQSYNTKRKAWGWNVVSIKE